MVDYCPGCSRREALIQGLVDVFRVSQGIQGVALGAVDLAFRNSPVPGKIMSEGEALRSWLQDYETIFSQGQNGSQGNPGPGPMMPIREWTEMMPAPKKKRKVSRYQREFGKQLKKLKRKHPRTKISALMKRAHTATKKALK